MNINSLPDSPVGQTPGRVYPFIQSLADLAFARVVSSFGRRLGAAARTPGTGRLVSAAPLGHETNTLGSNPKPRPAVLSQCMYLGERNVFGCLESLASASRWLLLL